MGRRSPRSQARRARLRGLRRRLRFWWRRRRLAASPTIRVLLIDGWTDGHAALADMVPGGSGRAGRVHFAFQHAEEPHYVLALLLFPNRDPPLLYPRRRLWYAIGEPPIPENLALQRTESQGAVVYSVDPAVHRPPLSALNDYRMSHCLQRTWRVHRGYDALKAMPLPASKPKGLSWITSDLALHAGHRRRLAFLERLRGGLDFDLFGRGFQPIEDKWDGLAPYRYAIAFENSYFDDYFSEKVADPIMAGCLPLYYGCPNLERYLPPQSFLRIDPDDPLVVDRIRDWVASDLWQERRPALEEAKALLLEKYNTFLFLAGEIERDFPRTFGR